MAKKVKKNKLADDIFASLDEALKYARGEKADVVVHRVIPMRAKPGTSSACRSVNSPPSSARRSAPCASGNLARDGHPARPAL
jgi:hypothetical protein